MQTLLPHIAGVLIVHSLIIHNIISNSSGITGHPPAWYLASPPPSAAAPHGTLFSQLINSCGKRQIAESTAGTATGHSDRLAKLCIANRQSEEQPPSTADGTERLYGVAELRLLQNVARGKSEIAPWAVRTGVSASAFAGLDRRMSTFLRKHRIPGTAIAITRNGHMVYSCGYGYADLAEKRVVRPDSLFRIASLSKPVTAVAVLQLAEQKKIHLDDPVLKYLNLSQKIDAAGDRFDRRWYDITVRHLLQHSAGWDRNLTFDPMFQSVRFAREADVPAPADAHTVIHRMLNYPLDFTPGTRYAYSNFGYCLLGRLIEAVTQTDYEAFVRNSVLRPLNITTMRIGRTKRSERYQGEVTYYHSLPGPSVFHETLNQTVASPYGAWYLEAMDSHGGWVASAEDLARFAMAFDFPDTCPVLTAASIQQMHERPQGKVWQRPDGQPQATWYSLGWLNRDVGNGRVNHWHNGSLPGTMALLIRRNDGINMVAVLNCRESAAKQDPAKDLDRLLHDAVNNITF